MPSLAARKLTTALTTAALLLAAPAAAMAQGAGDDQYVDPLGNSPSDQGSGDTNSGGNSGSGNSGNSGNSGSGTSTPATPSQSQDPAQTQTTTPTPAPQGGPELPRTGYPAWLAALAGGVLLASGATLRVSLGLRR